MYFICKKVSRRKNNGSRFARRVVLTMVGEGVGVARILLRGHPSVANESGCICMSRATNMFIVILTQSARNQQRVKATASISPSPAPFLLRPFARNMHEKTHRNICAHCCTGSTQLQKYFITASSSGLSCSRWL